MPLLPNPRHLKSGTFYEGQSKFQDVAVNRGWKRYSTRCQMRKAGAEVVAAIEAYCVTWDRAQRLLTQLADYHSDAAVSAFVAWVRGEFAAGRDPLVKQVGGPTFAEVTSHYLRIRRAEWAPTTLYSKEHTFRLFGTPDRIFDLAMSKESLAEFRDVALSKMSPHSVNIHLRNLRALANWAASDLLPEWTPPRIRLVKAPGEVHVDHLTPVELESLIAASRTIETSVRPLSEFLAFLAYTGMRRGEALASRWSWIEGEFLLVPAPATKTNRPRFVPLIAPLRNVLATLPQPHSGPIFPAMTIECTRLFQTARERAGIGRPLKLHNLRDTYIVQALRAGVPSFLVAEIVGNSERVIRSNYAHFAREDLAGVSARMERLWNGPEQLIEK